MLYFKNVSKFKPMDRDLKYINKSFSKIRNSSKKRVTVSYHQLIVVPVSQEKMKCLYSIKFYLQTNLYSPMKAFFVFSISFEKKRLIKVKKNCFYDHFFCGTMGLKTAHVG